MKIYNSIENFKVKNAVLTVGTFDGVHLGHRKLLKELVNKADEIGGEAVVFTLHPHPRKFLFPKSKLFFLNTIEEKAKLLEEIGIKHFIIYPFTKDFANLTSCNFIDSILFKQLKIKELFVGYDHRFGKDRQGNFNELQKCTSKFGIKLSKIDAFVKSEITISSTTIRNEILDGNINKANAYLSYKYSISGKVVSGNKIGRKIGFPTANIKISTSKIIPANGVYAVNVKVKNKLLKGMLNIGTRPTINNNKQEVIEVYLFDFEEDIYGVELKIEFVQFIRQEMKFDNLNELKNQLTKDEKVIRKILF